MQICLGGVYAWSAFVPSLTEDYKFSSLQTQLVFGTTIMSFTVSMIFAGRRLNHTNPKKIAAVGGILFAAGYLLASYSLDSFWLLFLGIGIVTGAGIGFGYVCPLTICIKWFPKHKGLVTGIAVAGFGGGSILLSALSKTLMLKEFMLADIFKLIGLFYGITIILMACFFSFPKDEEKNKNSNQITIKMLFKQEYFLSLCFAMFAGTFAGLLIISNLKPIALSFGLSPIMATAAISIFAIGNALGRILWGRFFDAMHYKTISFSLFFVSLAVLLLLLSNGDLWFFNKSVFLVGFGFGASFVVFATQVAEVYGQDELSKIYPIIFLFYGLSALFGPPIGGYIFDVWQSYSVAIVIAAILPLFAGFLTIIVKPQKV